MLTNNDTAAAFADFAVVLKFEGLRAALAQLQKGTPFRFIGIWRFADGKADAAVHFDREHRSQLRASEVPDTATYCSFVRASGEPFKTANALVDERLNAHPARASVLAYCGAPLIDKGGEILGTLCLYDLEPRDVESLNVELLVMVANYLAMGGHVPPYPAAEGASSTP